MMKRVEKLLQSHHRRTMMVASRCISAAGSSHYCNNFMTGYVGSGRPRTDGPRRACAGISRISDSCSTYYIRTTTTVVLCIP
jgi:hypothetical protein